MDSLANKNIKLTSSTVNNLGIKNIKIKKRLYHSSNINFKSNLNLTHFIPLKREPIIPTEFATMDIETINYSNKQIPIAISLFISGIGSKFFIINSNALNMETSINELWKQLFDYLINHYSGVIFVHNLGNFDGYFIFKALSNYTDPTKVSAIIDDKNQFIKISLGKNIIWKDSFRIFPVSLKELCNVFGVEGKSSEYNPEFNDLSLFNKPDLLKEFITYSFQDSVALYQA